MAIEPIDLCHSIIHAKIDFMKTDIHPPFSLESITFERPRSRHRSGMRFWSRADARACEPRSARDDALK
jgi:hypothetical protein